MSDNYPDITNIELFDKPLLGTRAYIAFNKEYNAIQIVFRGTDNFSNYLEDLSLIKT